MTFTLATLVSRTVSTGSYSYIPLYTTTIDVYPTRNPPSTDVQPTKDASDTGALFYLNIPIPNPGSYIIMIDCSDRTSAFINYFPSSNTTGSVPYPISIPGVISLTGNDFYDYGKADSATYFKRFYYPFYNMGIRLSGCPATSRTAVTATTATAPVISLNGNVITSSAATGNSWYRDNTLLDSTGQSITAIYSGVYTVIVNDATTGCSLTSNAINFKSTGTTDVDGASIGLKVTPNPNTGVFQLSFYFDTQDNTNISLLNTLGQKVYESNYSNFVGQFSQQINAGSLASGMYVLKIVHGNKSYIKKILVKK